VPIKLGMLTEGYDYLILRAYLGKMLHLADAEIESDSPDGSGHGHEWVKRNINDFLKRFYHQRRHLVIISTDNDGNVDLQSSGRPEDPSHPRHWLHAEAGPIAGCRWCHVHERVESVRRGLNWFRDKPVAKWPIIIAIPVEAIEAWLLATRAIVHPGQGSKAAEQQGRSGHKLGFYGRPEPTLDDVKEIAVPLIQLLEDGQLRSLRQNSRSFDDFAGQIDHHKEEILTSPP